MKRKQQSVNESRRQLLGGALALGGHEDAILATRRLALGAVGAGLGVLGVNLAPRATPVLSSAEKPASRGYRETEHIRQYYRTTV